MKRTRNVISSIVIFLLLLAMISPAASCAKSGGGNNSGATDNAANGSAGDTTSPDASATTAFPEPDVPVKDYGGANFNILYPYWGMYKNYFFAEEQTGDSMNDAIYKRDQKIEEQLNIKFNPIQLGNESANAIKDIMPAVKKSVLSGDGAYDLVLIHPMCDLGDLIAGQYALNWNKVPDVDLTQPYWNQSLNSTIGVKDILPFAANDYIIPDPCAVFFNKGILQSYGLDDPYTLVKNGQWTWDKLTAMAKQASKDVNGDGVYDLNDQYGFASIMDGPMIGVMHSCNMYIATKDADDVPQLYTVDDKLNAIINKMYDLIYNGSQSYCWAYNDDAAKQAAVEMDFTKNQALFQIESPSAAAQKYRAMDVDFGILPFPKYDEAQTDYISLNNAGLMFIPADAKDVEKCGIVAELLGAYSRQYTLSAYFDVLLNSKVARDTESEDMLNIIYNNCVYDFGYNYNGFTNISYIIPRLMAAKSTNVASWYESNAPAAIKTMQKVYDSMLKYEN